MPSADLPQPTARDSQLERLKVPPHSVEAEQSVIGGLMLSPEEWDTVSGLVAPDDFYRPQHQTVFRTMGKLVEARAPIDVITVSEALAQRDELEAVGGLAYLGELASNTPSTANIRAYAEIVRERSMLRQMIGAAREIADAGFYPEGRETGELLAEAESKLARIAENRRYSEGPLPVNPLLRRAVDRIDELFRSDGNLTGIGTGFMALDEKTSGLQAADLVIVAARPSMGKTALAMNLAEHAALHQDRPVVVFSMEMPAEAIIIRMLSSLGRIDQKRIREGKLAEEDWPKLSAAVSKLKDRPLFIDDTPALTPAEVRSRLKRIQREHGPIAMVMLDYLQLMQTADRSRGRVEEISEISRSLKSIAKEFDTPVVALSQLNRSLEQRPNKRPVNADLRESGAIEQDADLILFIYRDEYYNEDSPDQGLAEIIIGKHRNGPTGTCRLAFFGEYTRFDNLAHSEFVE